MADVFDNNGQGERGDLGALVKAILLDEEARNGHIDSPQRFGKIKEPILKLSHLWRAFDVRSPNNRIELGYPDYYFNQAPLSSPSVFNFFLPTYTEPGELSNAGMVAPELQIITETFVVRATNAMAYFGLWGNTAHNQDPEPNHILIEHNDEAAMLEDDVDALITHLNLVLMAGSMSENYQNILKDALALNPYLNANEKVANLIFLIISSPQFAVQQ
jgi:hypothetical protein